MVKERIETRDSYQTYDPVSGMNRRDWICDTYDLISEMSSKKSVNIT
jgi:hypothetical protein